MRALDRTASSSVRKSAAELRGFFSKPMTSFYLVVMITLALVCFGLVMMASASAVDSIQTHGSPYYLFERQLLWAVVGLVMMVIAMKVPIAFFRKLAGPLMIMAIVMLMLVLVPGIGVEIYGGRRWFAIGSSIQMQPSEIGKVAYLLWGAHVLVRRGKLINTWRGLMLPLLPGLMLLAGLVVIEPDLGTTLTYLIIFLALLWTVGCPIRLFTLLGAVIVGAAGLLIWAEPYRLARVTSFLDPMADPLGRGHQALQSLYALGTGGLTGVGLGNSRSKWGALPNGHSDFIFAIIGEELGLIGAITVLLLFAALIYAGLRIAHRSSDPFIKLVAAAIVIWQVSQAMINIGYVINLLPVTGITLPMISSGGTSLVITMFMMGILASCARHEPAAVAYLHRRSIKLPRMLRLHVPPSAICSDPRRTSPPREAPSGGPWSPARTVKSKPAAARTTARAAKPVVAKRATPRPRAAPRRPSTAPPRRRAG